MLVIVSPEIFSRGRNADGSYNPRAVSDDWVYRELRLSLEKKKNIIPIFVNGANGFPANLPVEISGISRRDALTLNHENFQENLNKLIGRLVTPKHQLLEQYFQNLNEERSLEFLVKDCAKFSEASKLEVKELLLNQIRKYWTGMTDSSKALEILLADTDVEFTKDLCRNLGINHRGGMARLSLTLQEFLEGKSSSFCHKDSKLEEDQDRLEKLAESFGLAYRSIDDRQNALELLKKLKIDFDTTRSSRWIFDQVLAEFDIEELFENVNFPEKDIKYVCQLLFEDYEGSVGRKATLISRICDYVNYVD